MANENNDVRFVAPNGMIFVSRDEYLDYIRSLRN